MNELTYLGQRLLEYLVQNIRRGRFSVGVHSSYVSYLDVLNEMGLEVGLRKTHGESLQEQGLNDLAIWTHATGHPAITGLIVERSNNRPSVGYWELYEQPRNSTAWWDDQIRRALDYDWGPFIGENPRPFEPPEAEDIGDPEPGRVEFKSTRIVRDTRVVLRVKGWHQNKYQVCKETFLIAPGRPYSEGHHIRPLGGDHRGPDLEENVLCVCPGCHVKLDFGGIPLVMAELNQQHLHRLNQEHLDYHNKCVFRGVL